MVGRFVLGAVAIAGLTVVFPNAEPVSAATSTYGGSLAPGASTQASFSSGPGTVNATVSCAPQKARLTTSVVASSGAVIGRSTVNCRNGGVLSVSISTTGTYLLTLTEARGVATSYSVNLTRPDTTTTTTTAAPTTTTTAPPTSTTTAPSPTTATTPPAGPPVNVCGNSAILDGPATAPAGAVVVPAGDNAVFFQNESYKGAGANGTVYWFAPGVHTLSTSMYGNIPAPSNTTYVGAPGAILDGQKLNRYAWTGKASGVTIKNLMVRNFIAPGNEGVVNHDFGAGWTIERNTIHFNGGAGALLGDGNRLSYNCLSDNSQYGFQSFGKNVTIDHNEVARNNTYNWETNQPGCGCSGGAKFWSSGPGTATSNYVHDNANVGLFWDNNNAGWLIQGNYISGNTGHGIMYETSYNAKITGNTFYRNALGIGQTYQARNDSFPMGALYISESGGDARVAGGLYPTLEVTSNNFLDNWAGVVLWENADRFGNDGSANTSKGYTTLPVDPTGAIPSSQMSKCGDPAAGGLIASEPYRSDCRWMTKNVLVANNDFTLTSKAAIGCTTILCAQNALFSNYGTVPSWSPYLGRTVQQNITYNQNNRFQNNRYIGPWNFVGYEAIGQTFTLAKWQAAPYGQDAGSTIQP